MSFYLGRAYYAYVGLLERVLANHDLDGHLRPGMGHVLFALFEQDDCIIRDLGTGDATSPARPDGRATVRSSIESKAAPGVL